MVWLARVAVVAMVFSLAAHTYADDDSPPQDLIDHPISSFETSKAAGQESVPSGEEMIIASDLDGDFCDICNSCDCTCWDHCRTPLWRISAGAIFLTRNDPHSSPIARDSTDTVTMLNSNQFGFDWVTGTDVQITRRIDRTYALDAFDLRYFGVQSLHADASVDTQTDWRFPVDDTTFPAAQIDGDYRTQLYSGELNFQHNINCSCLTWLAGARWVQLNEQVNLVATDSVQTNYRATTQNNLYGAQIGLMMRLFPDDSRFTLRWTSKAGVYGNAARNYWASDSGFLSSDSRGQLAFVGDVNVTGAWRFNRHVSLYGGYQLLWLQEVAVAGDQFAVMDPTTQSGLNTVGGAFFNGAIAGVLVMW